MSKPGFLQLKSVKCEATEDIVGSDDLYGLLGTRQFEIGSFVQGQEATLDLEIVVPPGVTTLQVFERDIDPNDLLGEVDLAQEMDVERVVTLWAGRARYVLQLQVTSEPEG